MGREIPCPKYSGCRSIGKVRVRMGDSTSHPVCGIITQPDDVEYTTVNVVLYTNSQLPHSAQGSRTLRQVLTATKHFHVCISHELALVRSRKKLLVREPSPLQQCRLSKRGDDLQFGPWPWRSRRRARSSGQSVQRAPTTSLCRALPTLAAADFSRQLTKVEREQPSTWMASALDESSSVHKNVRQRI